MKPFNLEEAMTGSPVCTRGGDDARIICWDRKGAPPIIALISINGGCDEGVSYHKNNGMVLARAPATWDLFMKTTTEKRWCVYAKNDRRMDESVYSSYKDVEERIKKLYTYCAGQDYQIIEFEVEI
jgi:hypothetical protein